MIMPNWCSVTYACITKDEKEAKKLYNAIYSMDKSRNPLAESDFGKLWLGCFVKQLGGDEGKIRCRGEILTIPSRQSMTSISSRFTKRLPGWNRRKSVT